MHIAGDIVARLLLAESQLAQQEQQLNAVTNQQEALQDVVTKLVNSLEQQQNTTNKAMHNDLCELQQQVSTVLKLSVQHLRTFLPASMVKHL